MSDDGWRMLSEGVTPRRAELGRVRHRHTRSCGADHARHASALLGPERPVTHPRAHPRTFLPYAHKGRGDLLPQKGAHSLRWSPISSRLEGCRRRERPRNHRSVASSEYPRAQIRWAGCDVRHAETEAITHHCPSVTRVIDPFCPTKALNEAVDAVRKEERRPMAGEKRKAIKDQRW
jgi:hypothetical protein